MNDLNRNPDPSAVEWDEQLYSELHSIAEQQLRNERAGHTLQATAVVHEAYLRLADQRKEWANREQFVAIAARVMRRALVDHARRRAAQRRGGDHSRVYLTHDVAARDLPLDILDLEDLLGRLEELAPDKARLAELHLFGGLDIQECAGALGISRRTATYSWAFSRAWLKKELGDAEEDPESPRDSGE